MVAEARSERPNRICCPVWEFSMESLKTFHGVKWKHFNGEMSSGTGSRLWNRKRELKKINPLLISLSIFPHS